MSNVITKELGKICKRLSSGKNIVAKDIKRFGEFPVYGANGLRGFTDSYNFDGECVIIGRQGAYVGNVRYFAGKAYMSEHAVVAQPKDTVNCRFLACYLSLINLGRLSGQSAQPGLSVQTLSKEKINLPPFETQNKIAKTIDILDKKIELNNKINAELEAMAKTIYDYWFLQFDFPNEEGKPYRSSGGKMVWNEQLKREIPEGWEVKPISEWIKSDKSGDWGKESIKGNYQLKVLCIRGTDINGLNGKGELNAPIRYILKKNNEKLLKSHDLIVEISGGSPTQSTGRLGFVTNETLERFSTPAICSNFCKAFTLQDRKLLFNFVYQWNNLYDNGVLFGWEGKTSGIKNLLFENFVSGYKMPFPPSELVSRFYDYAKSIHVKTQKTLIENQELAQLRDWLLPMLMNGQVTVEERASEKE